MTSYLHRSKIWMRETPLLSLMSWWRLDVTWRHMTSFSVVEPKKCWRQQKCYHLCHPNVFSRREFLKTEKMRGNHFSRTFRSDRIMISTFVGFLMTSTKKCWRQQNILPNVCRMWVKFKIGMMTHICAKFHAIWTYISEVRTGAYMPLPR